MRVLFVILAMVVASGCATAPVEVPAHPTWQEVDCTSESNDPLPTRCAAWAEYQRVFSENSREHAARYGRIFSKVCLSDDDAVSSIVCWRALEARGVLSEAPVSDRPDPDDAIENRARELARKECTGRSSVAACLRGARLALSDGEKTDYLARACTARYGQRLGTGELVSRRALETTCKDGGWDVRLRGAEIRAQHAESRSELVAIVTPHAYDADRHERIMSHIDVAVGTDGAVEEVWFVQNSGAARYERRVIQELYSARVEPVLADDGEPVRSWITLTWTTIGTQR